MRARTASGVRHSERTRKKSATAELTVRSPMPRPKLPTTLWTGAIEAADAISHHARERSSTQRRTRTGRSSDALAGGAVGAGCASQASAVAITRIGSAQALGSS